MNKKITFQLWFLLLLFLSSANTVYGEKVFISIGTGSITGIYYPTGSNIAKIINKKPEETCGICAFIETTGGSVFNVNAVMNGNLHFGLIQSDKQYQAVHGQAEWKNKGPQKSLRAVFSLYPETICLLASADSGINNVSDLRGKRVNIGHPGSGNHQNGLDVLNAAKINPENDLEIMQFSISEAAGMLQEGRIDALFFTVGHPSSLMQKLTNGAKQVKFIPIDAPLFTQHPYYKPTEIPIDMYPEVTNTVNVPTFQVKATLITSSNVPADLVYDLTKEIFISLDAFKAMHPAYSTLSRLGMLEDLSAPIHEGALRYYREAGLIK